MDDLALLKDMADRTPLPDRGRLTPARDQLLAEIADRPARSRRSRRLLLSGGAVVGLAAAITAVIAVGGLSDVGVEPPSASAAEVLHDAAAAARKMPDVAPRPDQFVYTKTQNGTGAIDEFWQSADGAEDGLSQRDGGDPRVILGCRDGRQPADRQGEPIPGETQPCVAIPGYLPNLPTDAQGMHDYLLQHQSGEPGDANALGKDIYYLLSHQYLSPRSRAAVFEALAMLDGLTVTEHAADAAGRPGIGVSWSHYDSVTTIVFDRTTHELLGMVGSSALLETAIVDEAGQRP